MIERVHALLKEYEEKQTAGVIDTFTVKITTDGLEVLPQPAEAAETKRISLSTDLKNSLDIFFFDIDGIVSGSYDYTTLKSLMNAHGTLERMATRTGQDSKLK